MATVLLDTNVASYLHPKKKNSVERKLYEPHIIGNIPALSFQTVAELWKWPEKNGWGHAQIQGFDAFLHQFVILPYDYRLAQTWASVSVQCEAQGRRLESGDCWIASTAVAHNVTLLTHDHHLVGLNVNGLTVISYINQTTTP
jgi:predicted nucleic acid-binding protein